MNNTFIQHLSILSPPLHPFNHISYHFNFIVHKMLYKIVAYTSILKIWGKIVLGLTEGFPKLSAFHAVIFVWCYTPEKFIQFSLSACRHFKVCSHCLRKEKKSKRCLAESLCSAQYHD